MAFLDTDFAKILLGSTPYMQQRMRMQEEGQRQQQFMEAAYETGQLMRPGEAGPPAAYRSATGVSPEFAMRVASMPGYQQLGASMISDMARAGVAREGREWEGANMTAAQRATLDQRADEFRQTMDAREREFGAQMDWRDYEFRNLSKAQRAQLGLQAQGQAEAARRWDQEMALRYPQGGRGPFPMPGSKEFDDQYQSLQGTAGAIVDLGRLQDTWNSAPWGFDREAMGRGDVLKQNIIGVLGRLQGTGALNEGDVQRFSGMLSEPSIFSSSSRRNAALNELRQVLMSRLEDTQARNPYLPRAQLPEGFTPVQPAQRQSVTEARPTYYGGRGGAR